MVVISIAGTSAVGKSLLVQQLSALNSAPAFFEGEEGIIPASILESVFADTDPEPRFSWFVQHLKKRLMRAHRIARQGMLCYVDDAVLTVEAIRKSEDARYHKRLDPFIEELQPCEAHVIILLTASRQVLKKQLVRRGRKSEPVETALNRALSIQEQFLVLSRSRENVLVLDRSSLDFFSEKDMGQVHKTIHDFCARLLPKEQQTF